MKYDYEYTILILGILILIFGLTFTTGIIIPELCEATNNCRTSDLFWIIFSLPTIIFSIIMLIVILFILYDYEQFKQRTISD